MEAPETDIVLGELKKFLQDCGGKFYYHGLTLSYCWDSTDGTLHFCVPEKCPDFSWDLHKTIRETEQLYGDILRHRNMRTTRPDSPDTVR